ncbi:MAG: NAD(P)/FAD-dependent oxidoreductase [Flavitalea sp.]
MSYSDYDAVVVGAGPNGLSAAITLQQSGLSVLLLEASEKVGGGMRTAELTLPGFRHDICSAIHPMAMASPFFKTLPLQEHGLQYIFPPISAAHPFDDGSAALLYGSLADTAKLLGDDEEAYRSLLQPVVKDWLQLSEEILAPFHVPKHLRAMAKFGIRGIASASAVSKKFSTRDAKGLWAGMAAHSILPLSHRATAAFALVLLASGHAIGWPMAKGGSQSIANALSAYFTSIGGKIITGSRVSSLNDLPSSKIKMFDITPSQLLKIAGKSFSWLYQRQLERFRYGPGIFKIDWALDGPIPFSAVECRYAGTVHLGNTIEEISASESLTWNGRHPDKPFVLLAQQSLFDLSRAPEGKHTAWAYCHVPNGSLKDMTEAIENQVERFAPGFRSLVLARHVFNTADMESYNANYIGGDINGGAMTLGQLYARPALRISPYRTSAKSIYICSSSTPPGGGVHGMCGHHAARQAIKDIFGDR